MRGLLEYISIARPTCLFFKPIMSSASAKTSRLLQAEKRRAIDEKIKQHEESGKDGKVCKECGEVQGLEEFQSEFSPDQYLVRCKSCRKYHRQQKRKRDQNADPYQETGPIDSDDDKFESRITKKNLTAEDLESQRKCCQCKKWLTLDNFEGDEISCTSCKVWQKQHRKNKKDAKHTVCKPGEKVCGRCHNAKSIDEQFSVQLKSGKMKTVQTCFDCRQKRSETRTDCQNKGGRGGAGKACKTTAPTSSESDDQ